MVSEVTIDHAGRLVIPKGFRDRLHLTPGTRLRISEDDGRLVLSPDRPEPHLVERDGFLLLELPISGPVEVDTATVREDRIRELVEFALRR